MHEPILQFGQNVNDTVPKLLPDSQKWTPCCYKRFVFSEKLLDMQQMVSHKLDRMTNIKSSWEQKLTFARVIKQEASDGTG